MMNTNTWQLILVVTGGLIGIFGALASTLTTAFLAERKLKLELRHKLQELTGNRQALEYLVGKQGKNESIGDSTKRHFLKLNEAERLAFTIGFLNRANALYEVDAQSIAELRSQLETLLNQKQQLELKFQELATQSERSCAP